MADPGTVPTYSTDRHDDCMRMAFSCVTGVHPRRLRFIDPRDDNCHFWDQWRALALRHGYELDLMFNFEDSGGLKHPWPVDDDQLWIAGVQGFHDKYASHGIVMRGQRLHYDPSSLPRTQRPKRIDAGWSVTPIG